MKKLFIYTAVAVAGLFISCQKDEATGPAASNLDATTLTHTAAEGAVTLKWAIPANANYKYIEVKYHIPGEAQERMRLASVHADMISIDNLLAAYGDVEYRLTPVTSGGKRGATLSYKAQCLPVPPRTEDVPTKLILKDDELWTNAQEPTEGPIKHLIDGNASTYFHTRWQQPHIELPHYIVVKLPTDVNYKVLSITYKNRTPGTHNAPKDVEVYVTKEFDGKTFDPDKFSKVQIGTATGLQPGDGTVNALPNYTLDDTYNYLWFKVTATTDGRKFISMSEFEVFRHKLTTFNPETGETTEL